MQEIGQESRYLAERAKTVAKLQAALLLCFLRTSNIGKVADELHRAGIERVYVSIDGPRDSNDIKRQAVLLDELRKVENLFKKFIIRRFSSNYGIGVAVIKGLDWFFKQEDCGVIIEDDIEIGNGFLKFADISLREYEHETKIWLIGGSRPIPKKEEFSYLKGKTLISNYPLIWGWASWASRWERISASILQLPQCVSHIPNKVEKFWEVGHRRVIEGLVDTWDTPLAASMRFTDMCSIIPPVNLVKNTGFDEFASHQMTSSFPLGIEIEHLNNVKKLNKIEFKQLEVNLNAVNEILEKEVFKIRSRHALLPIYTRFREGVMSKYFAKAPLRTRLTEFDSKETGESYNTKEQGILPC